MRIYYINFYKKIYKVAEKQQAEADEKDSVAIRMWLAAINLLIYYLSYQTEHVDLFLFNKTITNFPSSYLATFLRILVRKAKKGKEKKSFGRGGSDVIEQCCL